MKDFQKGCKISGFTKLSNNSIETVLRGHVHQASSKAVVREDQEHFPQNGADIFQLLIIKILQNKSGDGCDDADEQVCTSQCYKCRTWDGKHKTCRIHQWNCRPTEQVTIERNRNVQKINTNPYSSINNTRGPRFCSET